MYSEYKDSFGSWKIIPYYKSRQEKGGREEEEEEEWGKGKGARQGREGEAKDIFLVIQE